MAQWQMDSSKTTRKANNFSKGLDTEHSSFFVDENCVIDGYGFDFDSYPAVKVRAGRTNQVRK